MSEKRKCCRRSSSVWFLTIAILNMVLALPAAAALVMLADGNSSASIALDSQAGMCDWVVDGVDHMNQQWFWYRTSADSPEESIDKLNLALHGTFDTNFDGSDDTLYSKYTGAGFDLELSLRLDGGALGSQASDMGEQISITNTGDSVLEFWFFQYVNFDLGGTPGNDTAQIVNANAVEQTDISGFVASETVVTPAADRYDVLPFGSTLISLNDNYSTELTNSPGPVTGDVTWAFQWDFEISPGGTVQISKDKRLSYIIPEPTTLAILALGVVPGLLKRRRGHSARS